MQIKLEYWFLYIFYYFYPVFYYLRTKNLDLKVEYFSSHKKLHEIFLFRKDISV